MKKKSDSKSVIFIITALIAIAFYVFATANIFDTTGYIAANVIKVAQTSIILGNNCTAIIAETSPERADAIDLGIRKIIKDRPNAYDSFATILKFFNITVESVRLEKFDGRNYYADLILLQGDRVLKLDTRPSDAIALALRTNSTIYINSTLLKEQGQNIC